MKTYSINPSEFRSETAHLTPIQELAYRRLLDWCYEREVCEFSRANSVSNRYRIDVESLSIGLRIDVETLVEVLNEFFLETDFGWRSEEIAARISAYRARSEVNKRNSHCRVKVKVKQDGDMTSGVRVSGVTIRLSGTAAEQSDTICRIDSGALGGTIGGDLDSLLPHGVSSNLETAKNKEYTRKEEEEEKKGMQGEEEKERKETLKQDHEPCKPAPSSRATSASPRSNVPEKPEEVSEEVWKDFLAQRRAIKAPLTATALKIIINESNKAGWFLETALQECIVRGWRGFKAEWVNKPAYGGNNTSTSRQKMLDKFDDLDYGESGRI